MAFLKPDETIAVCVGASSITIKAKIIPDNLKAEKNVASWCKKGKPMKPCKKLSNGTGQPKGITVHNTADIKTASGTNPAEQYSRATYNGNMAGVVVHFYVYKSEIWQLLNENERGWHATDGSSRRKSQRSDGSKIGGNLDTIAIECIGDIAESEATTAKLVAYLCKKYGLNPSTDVYQHNYFYPSKKCPEYIRPHWAAFLANVKEYYNALENKSEKETAKAPADSSFLVKIIDDDLNIRSGAGTNHPIVGHIRDNGVYTIVETNKDGTWGLLKSYKKGRNGWICIKSKYAKKV